MNKSKLPTKPTEPRGPGYYRMRARLGADNVETLRLQVLKEQAEALGEAHEKANVVRKTIFVRDRTTYVDYPLPKSKKSKRHK